MLLQTWTMLLNRPPVTSQWLTLQIPKSLILLNLQIVCLSVQSRLTDLSIKLPRSVPVRDVRKFKETKKHFDRVREDMEIAQVKNAQAPRNKPHEVEEAAGTLSITRKCFRHLALDYVLQVRKMTAWKLWAMRKIYDLFLKEQYSILRGKKAKDTWWKHKATVCLCAGSVSVFVAKNIHIWKHTRNGVWKMSGLFYFLCSIVSDIQV